MADFNPCDFLFERWKNLALWRNLWTILIFLFGAFLVIFLVSTIFLFIKESWISGALTTVGAIVDGVVVRWVLARRDQAVAEETQAKEELLRVCGPARAATPAGLESAPIGTTTEVAVAEVESRLKLFGKFR
jgi:small-conductance mechanosensitive channel